MQTSMVNSQYGTLRTIRDGRGAAFYNVQSICDITKYSTPKKLKKSNPNSMWRDVAVSVGGEAPKTQPYTDKETARAILDKAESSAKSSKAAIAWLREMLR